MILWCVDCGLGWIADNELDECPVCDLQQELKRAANKLKNHKQALEVYADDETWDDDDWGIKSVNVAEYGNPGKIARKTLREGLI